MTMKILLTGSTGAIGPYIVSELEKTYRLVLFARRPFESPHEVIVGKLDSIPDCLRAFDGVDGVVHLAAYSEPDQDAFRFNMMSTYAMLEATRQSGVSRFIFASTICVYGHCFPVTERGYQPQSLPFTEEHPCLPEDNYGLSKRLCEDMLAIYSRVWGIKTAALRFCWIWTPSETRWRKELKSLDVARYAPYLWGYVDVRDSAQAVRLALEYPALPSHGAYIISANDHMADEESTELAERFYPTALVHGRLEGRKTFFDWGLAKRAFGYQPMFAWQDG